VRNALVLSTNAPGFPHLFARTQAPVATRIGMMEARWLVGRLSESRFFDTTTANDLRSVSAMALTLAPRGINGLTIGATRMVVAPIPSTRDAFSHVLDALRNVGTPNAIPLADTSNHAGPDQLMSIFARWTAPRDGFEAWVEWGRSEFPKSLRDFLEQPNHSQAFTIGTQWLSDRVERLHGQIRVQGEASVTQQSTTFRFRPTPSWYTSAAVTQGFTNEGQVLGAAIGPGSSSEWLAADHLSSRGSFGLYLSRIRWLEDARSQAFTGLPLGNSWCESDASFTGGARGEIRARGLRIAADYSTGWRYDVFFRHDPNSCPFSRGSDRRLRSLILPSRLTFFGTNNSLSGRAYARMSFTIPAPAQ
jgi:hypothetical protein